MIAMRKGIWAGSARVTSQRLVSDFHVKVGGLQVRDRPAIAVEAET